jgi:hypothetical protein
MKLKDEQIAKFKGKRGTSTLVDKLINDGVQLAPCDWGYCVYSQALSSCLGDAKGPNESRRSPDVCSGCANFAVTEKHRGWWEARFTRDEKFLLQEELPEQTVVWVRERKTRTAKILAGLNKEIHEHPMVSDESKTR